VLCGFAFSLTLLFLLVTIPARSQTGSRENDFKFYFDINRYHYSDSLTYLEFYADLDRGQLEYVPHENGYRAEYIVTAELYIGDSTFSEKKWTNQDMVDSLAQVEKGQRLFCQNYFLVPPDSFDFRISVEDTNASVYRAYSVPLNIRPDTTGSLHLSDIQLATSIVPDTSRSIFVKNGFRITPNPARLYGLELPLLYSYLEIYNLTQNDNVEENKYRVEYRIYNEQGDLVKSDEPKLRTKPGASAVDINRMSVVTLHSGSYRLVISVQDMDSGSQSVSEKKFYVFRQGDQEKSAVSSLIYPFADMTEKELDQQFEYTRYINSREQRSIYEKSDLEGKKKFLVNFWNERNAETGTTAQGLTFYEDYMAKVKYANDAFRGRFEDGWETDRGRVLLMYGKPDEVERAVFGMNKHNHEVWHYWNLDGSAADFIFVDRRGLGRLELVHSTHRGEIYNPDWMRYLGP
jgi:GWxTD domain-containing protein